MILIPGYGVEKESCSFVKGYISCPGRHVVKAFRQSCQRIECPECYMDWASKASGRITDVLRGTQDAYRNVDANMCTDFQKAIRERKMVRRISHVVMSPAPGFIKTDENLNSIYKRFYLFLKHNHIFTGGFVVYHPYRIRPDIRKKLQEEIRQGRQKADYDSGGLWEMLHNDYLGLGGLQHYVYDSPHFHLLAFGGFPPSNVFHDRTGWIYKNLGSRDTAVRIEEKTGAIIDEVKITAKYLLTHCAVMYNPEGRLYKTYRFYGLCSAVKIRVAKEYGVPQIRKVYESVLKCPVCGERLVHCAPIEGVYSPYKDERGEIKYVKTKLVFRKYEVIEK